MGKVSVSVLVIWVVVAASVVVLYPLAETTLDGQINMDSRNLKPLNGYNNSQSDVNSENLQSEGGSTNFNSNVVSGNSQLGSDAGNVGIDSGNGNKYLVNNFILNLLNFTAEITNQHNRVTGDGFYEISTKSANHQDVLQNGTFTHSLGTFTINNTLRFTPENNKKYHIHVYTNYPEHDNRVSKYDYTYSS